MLTVADTSARKVGSSDKRREFFKCICCRVDFVGFSSGRKDLRRRHFLVVVVEDVGHRFFFLLSSAGFLELLFGERVTAPMRSAP